MVYYPCMTHITNNIYNGPTGGRHYRRRNGWRTFWLVVAGLFVVGLVAKFWYVILVAAVITLAVTVVRRRRAAAASERARLLHNAYLPHPDAWLTPDEWARRSR